LFNHREQRPQFLLGRNQRLETRAKNQSLARNHQAGLAARAIGEAVVEQGLVAVAPLIKSVLGQILQGR
jgi:hypothetical protein